MQKSIRPSHDRGILDVGCGPAGSAEWLHLRREQHWDIHDYAECRDGIWHTDLTCHVHFPDDAHDELFAMEDGSFWFQHRNRVIENSLCIAGAPAVMWEIGAGNGCVAHHLQRQGLQVVAVEPLAAGARNARRRGIRNVVCGRFESLQLPADAIPAVGCFDVLEHLERPEALLAEIQRTLSPAGLLVVTVPAHPWLWSEADAVSGHFRRYTRKSLSAALSARGFEVLACEYFMASMVIPMLCLRTLPSLWRRGSANQAALRRCRQQLSGTQTRRGLPLADALLKVESAIARMVPLPMGTSLLGVFRKRR